jgi:hypothetical protein
MGPEELLATYRTAWDLYFTEAHVERLMRRAIASGIKPVKIWQNVMQIHGSMHFEGVHPQQGGYFRRKVRTQRRHGVKLESPLVFYPRRLWELFATYGPFLAYGWTLHRLRKRIERDPTAKTYRDLALTPVAVAEDEELEMFHLNDSAEAAVAKAKGEAVARAKHTSVAAE